ncbi:MAG: hypothetical protein B6243_12075 [Anaerolineaceae bacterium 4572_5.2]|nr:MAG: hypothetical protein B6243_12075 [Anaerolineaceae bacterium 4572_5.2]
MSAMSKKTEQVLRRTFKYLNKFMMTMWRLGLGSWLNAWPEKWGQIMVLAHTGRRTGIKRYTPLNFAIVEGELYCTAGFGRIADWYRNMMAVPKVEVWLPGSKWKGGDQWWAGIAEDISGSEDRIFLMRQVLIGSGFAAYAAGINPIKMSDEELDAVSREYRLLHIQRAQALTGLGGPGDLAWVWPVAAMLLLPLALFRRRR